MRYQPEVAVENRTIRELMEEGVRLLAEAGVESPRAEVELILMEATGFSRSELFLHAASEITPHVGRRFGEALRKRRKRVPLQYILGKQGFRYLDILVDPGVLIPRPETELVVEEALKAARAMEPPVTVVDVGTGSGAIALSIASELSQVKVFALDISSRALALARRNAFRCSLGDKICFLKSDLLSSLPGRLKGRVNLVVANPPYVSRSLLNRLQAELSYEPRLALDGGETGLRFYPPLIDQSWTYLKSGGALVMEIGDSAEVVRELLSGAGFSKVDILPDFNKHPRIAIGYKCS